jgi:hypothetical protein
MIETPKEMLINLVDSYFKDRSRLVVFYGSQSIKSKKRPNSSSDIDFLVIYKNGTNPYEAISILKNYFKSKTVKYDYAWYEEDDFLNIVQNGIDYLFWINIIKNGEILHADTKYLSIIIGELNRLNPNVALKSSLDNRISEIYIGSRDIFRDLHVMLAYIIQTKYWSLKGIIPEYNEISSRIKEDHLIEENISSIFLELEEMRKDLKDKNMNIQKTIEILNLSAKVLDELFNHKPGNR